jgi:hypothetical protein
MTAALATGFVFVFAVSTSRAAEPVSEPPTFASRYAAIDARPDAVKGQEAPPNTTASVDRNDARASYRALIAKEAAQQGLAPEIAEAVMAVESGRSCLRRPACSASPVPSPTSRSRRTTSISA